MQIEKKDGRLEDFDRGKISRGVVAAGASSETAEAIATEAENWAGSVAVDGAITSGEIRNKVLELLQVQNPTAATNFEQYRKSAE